MTGATGAVKLVGLSSEELLAAARSLLAEASPAWEGRWPRAVALLTRQALERSMEELFAVKAPLLLRATYRAQLLSLRVWLSPEQAGRVAYAWGALSRACHHHAYELPPTVDELRDWLAIVEALSRTVGERVGGGPEGAAPAPSDASSSARA